MGDFAYKRDAKLQARLSTEVEALAKLAANSSCADCGDPKRVRFCSVTLGVFLCNRCYGLHRALGAHVTRGKCLGLDAWKPEEVELLRKVGNANARSRYEARLPPGSARPTATSSDREVAAWIKNKYERRAYYAEDSTCASPPEYDATVVVETIAEARAPELDMRTNLAPPAPSQVADLLGMLDLAAMPPSESPQPFAPVPGGLSQTEMPRMQLLEPQLVPVPGMMASPCPPPLRASTAAAQPGTTPQMLSPPTVPHPVMPSTTMAPQMVAAQQMVVAQLTAAQPMTAQPMAMAPSMLAQPMMGMQPMTAQRVMPVQQQPMRMELQPMQPQPMQPMQPQPWRSGAAVGAASPATIATPAGGAGGASRGTASKPRDAFADLVDLGTMNAK